MMTKPHLLQLCPFSLEMEDDLGETFEVCRYFAMPDAAGWLAEHGLQVQAIATGGHIGSPPELVAHLPNLGIVAINGVGYDKVDLVEAKRRCIRVTTNPGLLTDDVADLAVGLTISALRGLTAADTHVRSGAWERGDRPLARKVRGQTFGVLGLGQIGSAIARRLSVFGTVIWSGPNPKNTPWRYVPDLGDLAREADVLVIACAANAANRNLIDATILDALGPQGWLVNVARGSLVDEPALIAALVDGRVAGAALDVFADEPRVPVVRPGKVLALNAVGAIALIAVSTVTSGALSGYSLLAIGLVNSIMFPTIFTLACEGLGKRAADGSGIINVAIFGGAVVPLLTGAIADVAGSLAVAMAIPALCYAIIAAFGWYARQPFAKGWSIRIMIRNFDNKTVIQY